MGDTRNMRESKKVARIDLADAGANAGDLLSVANPLGYDVVITRLTLHVTNVAPGAVTGDFGVAANGTTSSDDLIDGVALDALGLSSNLSAPGTNGQDEVVWGAGEYVTGTASGDPTGLAGYVHIEYMPALD